MMTFAAFVGIDSCPLEGFNKEETEQILGLGTKEFQVALVLPFGYRAKPQPEQLRKPMLEVLEFI
jgi:nitroreductase